MVTTGSSHALHEISFLRSWVVGLAAVAINIRAPTAKFKTKITHRLLFNFKSSTSCRVMMPTMRPYSSTSTAGLL